MTPPPDDTDLDRPLDPDDDAVAAVLDGQATADQRRRVAREPVLRARLAELEAVRDALARPVDAPDEDTLARLRGIALDALDEGLAAEDGDEPEDGDGPADDGEDHDAPGPVVPLAPKRRGPARRLPPWPAVAAVVALLLGLGSALIVNDRVGTDAGEATAAGDAAAELDDETMAEGRELGADAAGGSADGGDGWASREDSMESGPTAAPDASGGGTSDLDETLATYPDDDALRRELEAVDPRTLQPPGAEIEAESYQTRAEESSAGMLCSQGLESVEPAIGSPYAARLVLVDGRRTLILSNPVAATAAEPSSTRITVFDPNGCVPLFAVQR